jgi:hypothetical protein
MTTHLVCLDDTSGQKYNLGGESGRRIPGTIYFSNLDGNAITQGGVAVLDQGTSFSGDISGIYNAITVGKIQGVSVESPLSPSNNHVLAYDDDPAQNQFRSELRIAQRVDIQGYAGYSYSPGGTWSVGTKDDNCLPNYMTENVSGGLAALDDVVTYKVFLTKGNYYVILVYHLPPNGTGASCNFEEDGNSIGTINFDNGGGPGWTYNQFFENSSYAVSSTSLKDVTLTMKQGSGVGLGYEAGWSTIHFFPI